VDLTERKKAEQALRSVQRFESLGFLAGGVAHNLNNLLVSVLGNVSLVLDDADLTGGDRALLENAMASSERAAELTSQLLAYAGKGTFVLQPVDVSALAAGAGRLLRTSIPLDVSLRFDLAPGLPPIEADERQMRQVITSLVINAAEAVGDAPGMIEISTRREDFDPGRDAAWFAVGALMSGPHVVLEVSDTGCGMDETTRSRIFEPFFSTKFTGRGLGLAAVAGIVRTLGGAVEVSTAPDRGSTFRVYLPVTAAARAAGE
jgi:signal transduction histidine kinase